MTAPANACAVDADRWHAWWASVTARVRTYQGRIDRPDLGALLGMIVSPTTLPRPRLAAQPPLEALGAWPPPRVAPSNLCSVCGDPVPNVEPTLGPLYHEGRCVGDLARATYARNRAIAARARRILIDPDGSI